MILYECDLLPSLKHIDDRAEGVKERRQLSCEIALGRPSSVVKGITPRTGRALTVFHTPSQDPSDGWRKKIADPDTKKQQTRHISDATALPPHGCLWGGWQGRNGSRVHQNCSVICLLYGDMVRTLRGTAFFRHSRIGLRVDIFLLLPPPCRVTIFS